MARRPRRSRLAAAAAGLAAAPDRAEPAPNPAAAGAGAGAARPGRLPPLGGRPPAPAAIVDTQSVGTGPRRGPRGYDAREKVEGRQRVPPVDARGDPPGVRLAAANVRDRDAWRTLAPDLDRHASWLPIRRDRGFAGDDPAIFPRGYGIGADWVGTVGRQGFRIEPRRRKVEPTFGCRRRYRRLRVDDEMSHGASRAMTVLAALLMTAMRLQRRLRP